MLAGFKMAKKKGSGRKQKLIFSDKRDHSDDHDSKKDAPCNHLSKAIHLQKVKNSLPHQKSGHCKDCRGMPKVEHTERQDDAEMSKSVCICLHCGYQGCSRQCNKQHAHNHFLQQASHTICINTTSWVVWCYACDNELSIENESSSLQKAVKYIREKLMKESKSDACESSSAIGKVKGLSNLGNTCFFNSVLQNISQTTVLVKKLDDMFKESETRTVQTKESKPKVQMEVKLSGAPGPLTTALKCCLDEFRSSSRGVIVPSKLFGEITKKSPQFRGYRQQDSHELLRYLLDGMRVEELKRTESAMKEIVKNMENAPSKEELRECLKNAKTFVDDVFGGTLVSTIVCTECKTRSQVYDSFLDLSLPVNNYQPEIVNRTVKQVAKNVTKNKPISEQKSDENNEVEESEESEKALSKHQKKVLARKDKKAKRRRRSSSIAKSLSDGGADRDVEAKETETIEDDNDSDDGDDGDDDEDGCVENKETKLESDNDDEDDKVSPEEPNEAKSPTKQNESKDDDDEMTKMMENLVIKDHKDFVLIEKKVNSDRIASETECSSEDEAVGLLLSSKGYEEVKGRCLSDEKGEESSSSVTNSNQQILGGNIDNIVENVGEVFPTHNGQSDFEKGCKELVQNTEKWSLNDNLNSSRNDDQKLPLNENGNLSVNVSKISESRKEDLEIQKQIMKMSSSIDKANTEESIENKSFDGELEMKGKTRDVKINNGEDVISTTNEGDKEMRSGIEGENREEIKNETETDEEIKNKTKINEEIKTENVEEIKSNADKSNKEMKSSTGEELKKRGEEMKTEEDDEEIACTTKNEEDDISSTTGTSENNNSQKVDDVHWIEKVGEEYNCTKGECSVMSCLNQFSIQDWLTGNNKFRCDECTRQRDESSSESKSKDTYVYTVASKQMLLWKPSSVLTLHLKRFEHAGRSLRKVNKFIEFPVDLDMSPYFLKNDELSKEDLQYSLCGIVEHSGSLHGGHYVAYVKTKTLDNKIKWYHVSDSRVSEVQEKAVLRKQAYLLFYQRNRK